MFYYNILLHFYLFVKAYIHYYVKKRSNLQWRTTKYSLFIYFIAYKNTN